MKRIACIIPARYASSRFPGKPLANILGKPMIQWVYEKVLSVEEIERVIVATDDDRIYKCVTNFDGEAIMTKNHNCGTNRIAEVVLNLEEHYDVVLNIQGDEPMIRVEMIKDLIRAFDDNETYMATLKKEIFSDEEINNPNIAKVITDINNNAVYFSRSRIPYNRDGKEINYYKHIGVYGYTPEFLEVITNIQQSNLEIAEQLEQLRVIENGYKIKVVETKYESIGVDLPSDIHKVEIGMRKEVK
ncbi:3-deoxy-manno-octulosonate cytidylyltransferase [Clostridium paraputrificum]|uniref:3-deoxy-manno-octulosonate cytidylyltransferase n=1 Tax=Clostridium paraputrificum TaxID=29363 RepID=UPI003D34E1DD